MPKCDFSRADFSKVESAGWIETKITLAASYRLIKYLFPLAFSI